VKSPPRGEVWLVDLGMAAKVRPCLVVSVAVEESDRALVTLVPHTTSMRGSRFEVDVPVKFLRSGAFDAQGLVTVPIAWLIRRLGSLSHEQLGHVEAGVRLWLGLGRGGA
jgi:mRNA interferase MazF